MAITAFLDELAKSPPPSLSSEKVTKDTLEFRAKSHYWSEEEKINTCVMFRMKGVSVQSLALSFDVHPSTIYRWLDKYAEDFRQRMEQKPAANLIAESLQFIGYIRDVLLYEADQIKHGEDTDVDKKTGELKRRSNASKLLLKAKYLEAALKAEKLSLNLMLDTGIIPREPDKIYHTLKGGKPDSGETFDERSEEEVQKDVWRLLQRGRRL